MARTWLDDLRHDATAPLLDSGHAAVTYLTKRDVLGQKVPPAQEVLWNQKIPQSILRKQKDNGSWAYPAKPDQKPLDYDQLETYRQLGLLIEMFCLDRQHPGIQKAAEYVFGRQTPAGEFRGIYANQYTPNYTAALLELVVKAGYANDPRVARAFAWLDSVRQHDGGWALPFRTQGRNLDAIYGRDEPLLGLDPSKPYSHLVTGVVLRAYATHPKHRYDQSAKAAAELLASRFFEKDVYPDRDRKDYWTRFSFPFWQTDILSSLDVIGLIRPDLAQGTKMLQAKQWFVQHQTPDGLFTGHLLKDRYHDLQLWYSFAICRAFQRF